MSARQRVEWTVSLALMASAVALVHVLRRLSP
jgi:hypothetical protein